MEIPYNVNLREDTGLYNAKLGIWLFLASEIMLFGGLFSAYILLRTGAPVWPPIGDHGSILYMLKDTVPHATFNTLVLIFSSVTMVMSWVSLKQKDLSKYKVYLGTTILCAFIFLIVKYFEYSHKIHEGFIPSHDTYMALYFTLTGLHGLHIIGGIIVLAYFFGPGISMWDSEPERFTNRIEVVVPDDQLSLAIGRRGQNVRLASQLTGWDIDIMTEEEESDKRNEEFRTLSQLFVDCLDVDEVIAQLLVTEGFSSVEEVAFIPVEELAAIEGFDDDVCKELRERARQYLEVRDADQEKQRKDMGISDEIAEMESLTGDMLLKLGETGIKTLDDLADLAGDELMEVVGEKVLTEDQANEIIMAARAHWFEGEERVEPEVENTEDESKTLEPQTDSE